MCDFRMLCPVCLEESWHRVWCEYHPAASLHQSAWPPALQVASSIGGWMQPLDQMATDDGNVNGEDMNETPLVGLLSLNNNVNLGGPENQLPVERDNEFQSEGHEATEITWSLIEDVIGEDNQNEHEGMNVVDTIGPQTPKDTSPAQEVKIEQMWVSANDLAKALAKFVKKTGREEESDLRGEPQICSVEPMVSTSTVSLPECCRNGTCESEKRDSPRSPDMESTEEREREWRSDTSDTEMPVQEPYRPEVSSISSDIVDEVNNKNTDTMQGEKRKGNWSQSRRTRRVAHIRPQNAPVRRRALIPRRRGVGIPEFRMSIQAPVVQTHDVISRITLADGNVLEESMRLRCAMAEDEATQTVITMEMMAVAFGERPPNHGEEEEPRNLPEVGTIIDLTTDEQTEESDGTPVMDEHQS
jgi:hypothetical protein